MLFIRQLASPTQFNQITTLILTLEPPLSYPVPMLLALHAH
jgi:hypothetical protein